MGRVLSISRATVSPGHEAEYIQTVQALADIAVSRDRHLWLFRSGRSPGQFVEFSESRTELAHRVRASRTDREARLEQRLREIVRYAPEAWDLWEEVPRADPEADDT